MRTLALLTDVGAGKPDLAAAISSPVGALANAQAFLRILPEQFDVDAAIGAQLDIVGLWVGISRQIPEPVSDPWFRFDDVLRGFDTGFWQVQGIADNTFLASLDDVSYRRLIQAKILANNWNGTRPTAEAVLNTYFINPATLIWIQDNTFAATQQNFFTLDDPSSLRGFDEGILYVPGQSVSSLAKTDMSISIGVAGQFPNIVDLEILAQGLLPVKPAGVGLDIEVTSINGFDVTNDFIAGFDTGALGVSPSTLVSTQLNG
jgi:hypothetical protein